MRPVGRIFDIRSCGAIIINTPNSSVFASNRLIAVLGSIDSHGGSAVPSKTSVFIENLPVTVLGDLNSGCYFPWPHTGAHPLVTGDYNVFCN